MTAISFRSQLIAAASALAIASFPATAQTYTLQHYFDFTNAGPVMNSAGTVTGTSVGNVSVADGALHLTGSNSYVQFGALIPTGSDYGDTYWSVSLWARQAVAQPGYAKLVSQGPLTGYLPEYDLGLSSGSALALNLSGFFGAAGALQPSSVGDWHYFATTMNEYGVNLYVDGVLAQSGGSYHVSECCYHHGVTRFGQSADGSGGQFEGDLDDIRIYSGRLDSDAILAEYQAGHSALESDGVVTPEPASLMLVGTGLLALGGVLRKKVRSLTA